MLISPSTFFCHPLSHTKYDAPSKLACCSQRNWHPCRFYCARRTRLWMIPPSWLVFSSRMGAGDLPLCASNEGLLRPRVARAQKIIRAPSPLCSASKEGTWPIPLTPFQTSSQKTVSSAACVARYPSANASLLLANHPSCRRRGGYGR